MGDPPPPLEPSRRRAVTAALLLVTALASMESTVVSTAMPTIIGELAGLPLYHWVFAVYLFASTVSMPLFGRLADVHGRRRVLLAAIVLFVGGALVCAFARSMPQLIAARAFQGLGAGGLVPVALTVSGDLYSLEERARVQGLFSAVWGMASVLGPLTGAGMTVALGWRSIFWINLPLGFLAFVLVRSKLAAGVPAGRRDDHPFFPPGLFRQRGALAPYAGGILLGTSIYGVDTFVPLFVQGARGGTAGAAGAVVTPLVLCWSISATLGAKAVVRYGFRTTAVAGALLSLAGFGGLLAAALLDGPVAAVSLATGVIGLGLGPSSIAQVLSVQTRTEERFRGVATSLVPFFRTVGGSIGVAALGGVLSTGLRARLGDAAGGAARLLTAPQDSLHGSLASSARLALEHALLPVFLVLLVLAAGNVGISARFPEKERSA